MRGKRAHKDSDTAHKIPDLSVDFAFLKKNKNIGIKK